MRDVRDVLTSFEVAVRSFRLWKLKVVAASANANRLLGCSSFVPIVETERNVRLHPALFAPKLQFVRSDRGN